MPGHQPPASGQDRPGQIAAALRLVWASVVFGLASGAVSVLTGLANHSLSVLATGLGALGDVTGSAALVWRFRAERRRPGQSQAAEARAALMVAAVLAVASAVVTIEAAIALPGDSGGQVISARAELRQPRPGLHSQGWGACEGNGQG